MIITVLFYHPKDIKNVIDIHNLLNSINGKLIIIPRNENPEVIEYCYKSGIETYLNFDKFLEVYRDRKFLILETYGNKFIQEVNVNENSIIVLGAEDYGFPKELLNKIPDYEVVKIPMGIQGGSYNVVTCLVILIYEILRQKYSKD